MQNIFLVPAHPINLQATIKSSVNIEIVKQHLSPDSVNRLSEKIHHEKFICCWAFKGGRVNDTLYDQMQEGDLVLFKPNKIDRITHSGIVCFKARSASLGNTIWSKKADKPWELIYFLSNIKSVDINFSTFKARLGFNLRFPLQGTIVIGEARRRPIEREYGSFDAFINSLTNGEPNPSITRIPNVQHAVSKKTPVPTSPDSGVKEIQTKPPQILPEKDLLKGLGRIDDDINVLRLDRDHKERAHEALVQKFFELLDYSPHTEIKFQQGRIDICIEVNGKSEMVIEVKKDWSLTREDKKALKQAFDYSNEVGSRFVLITNGDYYAVYDKSKGWSYNDSFIGEFRISEMPHINFHLLRILKKRSPDF